MNIRMGSQSGFKPSLSSIPVRSGVVQRMCNCGGIPGPTGKCTACRRRSVQAQSGTRNDTRLSVSKPNDRSEREAVQIAERVIRMPNGPARPEMLLQAGRQRQPSDNDSIGVNEVPSIVQETLSSPGQPLDPTTRGFMESRLGYDFSQVRVHINARAAESAQAVNAHAYTVGRDIVFDAGQFMPHRRSGQALLAHELTHVVQQSTFSDRAAPAPAWRAEGEAQENSQFVLAGQAGQVYETSPFGQVQRQEKGKKKVSGGTELVRGVETKGEEVKNKFSFDANVKIPVAPGVKLGSAFILEDLKISLKGSTESAEPIGLTDPEINALQTQIVLSIARLEAPKLKLPANLGQLSLGAKLGASTTFKQSFKPEPGFSPALSATAGVEAGFTPPALKASLGIGELNLGGKLSTTGSLTQTFGEDGGFKPKLGAKAELEAGFKSRPSTGPALTLGGLLGEEARVVAGAEAGFETGLDPKSGLKSKLSAGGKVGLAGKTAGGQETFLNLKITGDVNLDLKQGELDAKSQKFFFGVSGGFKF
jgi:hypothetical protein